MSQDTEIHELEGDMPSTWPPSLLRAQSSHPSLRPLPLQFSKRQQSALNFSRPRPKGIAAVPAPTNKDARSSWLSFGTTTEASNDNGNGVDDEEEDYDDAAPPPTVRTYADLRDFDIERDSIDEALPPPIKTRTNSSYYGSDSTGRSNGLSELDIRRDSATVPLPTQKTSNLAPYENVRNTGTDGPRIYIYKPYLASRSSIASTNATYESNDTNTTFDAESIAESAAESAAAESVAETSTTNRSSVSDFAFDGQMGWNPRSNSDVAPAVQQRWSAPHTTLPKPSGPATPTPLSNTTSTSSLSTTSTAPPPLPFQKPRIVKRTSISQESAHINPWEGETMSDGGSISSGEWTSSQQDTSGLSLEKIHKLKKKGINPALYVEMKNARKGKSKWISPLQGNAFIS